MQREQIHFTIWTEDKGPEETREASMLVGNVFEGFTVTRGQGWWDGIAENAVQFHIVAEWDREPDVISLAETLKDQLMQEAVLVTSRPVRAFLV